jgi:hypothetical protein
MSESKFPSSETAQRLLSNLRRSRLEMQEVNFKLEEIIAALEHDIRQQNRRLNLDA